MPDYAADAYIDIAARLRELEAARNGAPAPKQEPMKVTTPTADEDDEIWAQMLLSGGF